MEKRVTKKRVDSYGIKISIEEGQEEIGRAYLYVLENSLHERPFGLMEDVFVSENHRGKGFGKELIQKVVEVAKEENCYKLLATSRYERPKVHDLYKNLGFQERGLEFRIDL